ncbi:MAG: hypothetical protein HY270_09820 [Deltaproteobacteria bacterium]|nr:hypothetical protein [Deltaproteobacteria bacterium]
MTRPRGISLLFACATFVWTFASLGCGGGGGSSCPAKNAPDVSGTWMVDNTTIDPVHTDCPSELNSPLLDEIEGSSFGVTQNVGSVTLDDHKGDVLKGCVADSGDVSGSAHQSGSEQGCNVSVNVSLSGNFNSSPTNTTFRFVIHGSGACSLSCTLTLDSRFTRMNTGVVAAAVAPSGGAYVDRILGR